jgi:DNA-directed RNA polymerase subunit RPC12/RpoP
VPLHLIPSIEPDPNEKARQRVRKMPRPDGLLQCNRCGSRTVLNTENGVVVKDGRRRNGTKIETDVCADCWKQGIAVQMQPAVKPAT